jgi:hypothetical protein
LRKFIESRESLRPEKFHGIQTRRWIKIIFLRKFIG